MVPTVAVVETRRRAAEPRLECSIRRWSSSGLKEQRLARVAKFRRSDRNFACLTGSSVPRVAVPRVPAVGFLSILSGAGWIGSVLEPLVASRCVSSTAPIAAGADLLACLKQRAVISAGEPWLFVRVGWDWKWWSWSEIARYAMVPIGVEVGFDAGSKTGRASAHRRLERPSKASSAVEPELGGVIERIATLARGELDGSALSLLTMSAGGLEAALAERPRPISRLRRGLALGESRRIAVEPAPRSSEAGSNEAGSNEAGSKEAGSNDGCELGWVWSLTVGGALVLPQSPARWLDAVLWSRPTDLWGNRSQLEELERAASTRAGRRALDRLCAFCVVADELVPEEPVAEENAPPAGVSPATPGLERLGVRVVSCR